VNDLGLLNSLIPVLVDFSHVLLAALIQELAESIIFACFLQFCLSDFEFGLKVLHAEYQLVGALLALPGCAALGLDLLAEFVREVGLDDSQSFLLDLWVEYLEVRAPREAGREQGYLPLFAGHLDVLLPVRSLLGHHLYALAQLLCINTVVQLHEGGFVLEEDQHGPPLFEGLADYPANL
jgi:hypothetical protein